MRKLIIKLYRELLESSYVSIVLHQIQKKKFIGLNMELGHLHISFSFWVDWFSAWI